MYSFDFLPNTTRHESKKVRQANTDNMGKLFVTVFAFAPASKTDL
jgi:hypothetical protein